MFKSIALLAILIAIVYANDISIAADFNAESASLTWQSVKINNLLSGDSWANATGSVSFSVSSDNALVLISGLVDGSVQVGTILAGSSGTGKFAVIVALSGSYNVEVSVSYKLAGDDSVHYYSQEFILTVDDNWFLRRDGPKLAIAPLDLSKELDTDANKDLRDIATRQNGNTDADLQPYFYVAGNGVKTWNSFNIIAGVYDLLNCTFSVFVTDSTSVGVFYPDDIGNSPGSINHNTTYLTSIGFQGGTGSYSINSSIRYRRSLSGQWRTFYMLYPLSISGDSSSFRAQSIRKIMAEPVHVTPSTILGAAVGGVALVAIVAVVATVVVLRKKQETIVV